MFIVNLIADSDNGNLILAFVNGRYKLIINRLRQSKADDLAPCYLVYV